MARQSEAVLTITLQKGLADRNRLPLAHVIKVLQEVRGMLIDAGREILKERGVEEPKNDFGLELLAEDGTAFHKGSVRSNIAITVDVEVGILAAQAVLETVRELDVALNQEFVGTPKRLEPTEARIVHRLERIAFINEIAKAEARFQVKVPKALMPDQAMKTIRRPATFGAREAEAIRVYRLPDFVEENLLLYGRLFELKDPAEADEGVGFFWGELKRDNGEKWRIQFNDEDEGLVTPLFRHQVMVTGTAHYYQTRSPKLTANAGAIHADVDRDYEAAFDELFGCEKQAFNMPLDELLKMRYGED
jgi:hypothetical protein